MFSIQKIIDTYIEANQTQYGLNEIRRNHFLSKNVALEPISDEFAMYKDRIEELETLFREYHTQTMAILNEIAKAQTNDS